MAILLLGLRQNYSLYYWEKSLEPMLLEQELLEQKLLQQKL